MMKKILVFFSLLACCIHDSKAGGSGETISLPAANELEISSTPPTIRISHKSGFSVSIAQDVLAADPKPEGPLTIGTEAGQPMVQYSILFKQDGRGTIYESPQRGRIWLAKEPVDNRSKWYVVTPSGRRPFTQDYEEPITAEKGTQFYFEKEVESITAPSAAAAPAPAPAPAAAVTGKK